MFGLFLAILTGGRLLWHESFKPAGQPWAEGGVLDLRELDMERIRTLTLDGEWEFYAGVFLMTGDAARDARIIRVPGKWDDYMRPEDPTPYGYGSYRLRILLDPGDARIYSLYVPSVRSSSKLYVNGELLHTSGMPASDAGSHLPVNKPFTAAFAADDSGVVEIVFEAANYSDLRGGGLVRSLKFGLNEALQ